MKKIESFGSLCICSTGKVGNSVHLQTLELNQQQTYCVVSFRAQCLFNTQNNCYRTLYFSYCLSMYPQCTNKWNTITKTTNKITFLSDLFIPQKLSIRSKCGLDFLVRSRLYSTLFPHFNDDSHIIPYSHCTDDFASILYYVITQHLCIYESKLCGKVLPVLEQLISAVVATPINLMVWLFEFSSWFWTMNRKWSNHLFFGSSLLSI